MDCYWALFMCEERWNLKIILLWTWSTDSCVWHQELYIASVTNHFAKGLGFQQNLSKEIFFKDGIYSLVPSSLIIIWNKF